MIHRFFILFGLLVSAAGQAGAAPAGSSAPTGFSVHPHSGSLAIPGATKVLVCSAADGSPRPVYRWLKDGRYLGGGGDSTGTLKIINIGLPDAGRYQCSASNALGAVLSRTAVVKVTYILPFTDTRNTERVVTEGDAVVFDLPPIDSYPQPSIQWLDGNGVAVPRNSENYHVTLKNQLVVLDARYGVDNNKVWRATATSGYTQQTSDGPVFILRVQGNGSGSAIPRLVVPPADSVAVQHLDEAVSFECVVNARPPSYVRHRWYWTSASGQTTDLSADSAGTKYLFSSAYRRVLTIRSPVVSDAGVYRCEAVYHRPSAPSSQDVMLSAEARLTVHVRPAAADGVSSSRSLEHKVESFLTIPCPVTGIPLPTVRWYRNAVPLNNTARIYVPENGSLVIKSAQEDDTATYQCFAVNTVGETILAVTLNIFSIAPYFLTRPENQTIVTGSSVRLACRASGAPLPTVSWSRVRATSGGATDILTPGNELVLRGASVADTGFYTCTAVNSKGTADASAYVRVTVQTHIINPVPRVTTAINGTDITLPCGVESDSHFPVIWSWFYNTTLIGASGSSRSADSRASVGTDGSLTLSAVSRSDAGFYTCSVESDAGRDRSSGVLHIIERPPSPWLLSASLSRETRSVDVMWLSDFGADVDHFIVYAHPVSEKAFVPLVTVSSKMAVGEINSSLVMTIHNLQPGAGYRFTVAAENEAGEGLPSTPSNVVNIPEERPSGPPSGISVISNSSSVAFVCWLPPVPTQWNGLLRGYLIRYRSVDTNPVTLNITGIDRTCHVVNNLEGGATYVFGVSCYNAAGFGPFSDDVGVVIHEELLQSPPTNISAVAVNSTAVRVSFLPPRSTSRRSSYKIFARVIKSPAARNRKGKRSNESNTTTLVVVGELEGHSLHTDYVTGLRKFTTYAVSVQCFMATGSGPESLPFTIQTLDDVPDAVQLLTVEALPNSSFVIHWLPPLNPNGVLIEYILSYGPRDVDEREVVRLSPNILSHVITTTVAETSYLFQLVAVTRRGEGPAAAASAVPFIPQTTTTTTTAAPPVTTISSVPPPAVQRVTDARTSAHRPARTTAPTSVLVYTEPPGPVHQETDRRHTVRTLELLITEIVPTGSTTEAAARLTADGAAGVDNSLMTIHWWLFVVIAVVAVSLATIVVIILVCWTTRRNRKRTRLFHINGNPAVRRQSASDMRQDGASSLQLDDEAGFTTIERRQRWSHAKYPHAGTLPLYARAPPRPSPGSIQYDGADVELHQIMTSLCDDDSGHASDRALQDIDEDMDAEYHLQTSSLHRLHRNYQLEDGGRPRSLYETFPSRHGPGGGGNTVVDYQTLGNGTLKSAHSSTFRPQPGPQMTSFT